MWAFVTAVFSQETIKGLEKEVKDVLDKVSPSIVKVVTEGHRRYVATGIAIEPDLVLTTTLVVGRPFERIYVQTVDNRKYTATVKGKDQRSSLTLLKLDRKAMAPLKRSERLKVGDWVALVGVFYNSFPAISQGLVSSYEGDEIILNIPIAPGASGGAVVNKSGELVAVLRGRLGFSSAPDLAFRGGEEEIVFRGARQKNMDLSYAIPSNHVMRIASQLEKHGRVKRGYFGVLMAPGGDKNHLAIVDEVLKGSPAEQAGIKKGDRIVAIDSVTVDNPNVLPRLVSGLIPGSVVKVELQRPQEKKSDRVVVNVGELDDQGEYIVKDYGDFSVRVPEFQVMQQQREIFPGVEQFVFQFSGGQKTLGMDVKRVQGPLTAGQSAGPGRGLLVKTVRPESAAQKAGIRIGDIIFRANGRDIIEISDLRTVLDNMKEGEAVKLELERAGKRQQISVVPEIQDPGSFNWSDFRDNLKRYSFQLDDNGMAALQKKMDFLKVQLSYLKSRLSSAQEYDLDKLTAEIESLKEKTSLFYQESLKKIERQKDTITNELDGLQRDMQQLLKAWQNRQEDKNKKSVKSNSQQNYSSELI